jgi:hypothetical protein
MSDTKMFAIGFPIIAALYTYKYGFDIRIIGVYVFVLTIMYLFEKWDNK